jgi:hypothetical protein
MCDIDIKIYQYFAKTTYACMKIYKHFPFLYMISTRDFGSAWEVSRNARGEIRFQRRSRALYSHAPV